MKTHLHIIFFVFEMHGGKLQNKITSHEFVGWQKTVTRHLFISEFITKVHVKELRVFLQFYNSL